jgi:RNA polymerase sigma factor (sigma-70 family)
MPRDSLRRALEHLRFADGGGLTDGQLLARFLDSREEAAFAALLRRHGPMVLGVCLRVLNHVQDAEDAFQASFLLLARKAASVVRREAVGSWLYRVAYRTALEARARAAKRRARERQVEEMPHPRVVPAEPQDWRPLLDQEVDTLPEKLRAALVLCDLEGRTRREAARLLRVSEGTLSSQLTRARRLLAKRLRRHGLSLSGGALAVVLAEGASAAVPGPLASSTVQAAILVAAGQAVAVATPAVALMNEVSKAMLMTKLKFTVAAVMVAVTLGAGGLAYQAAGQAPAEGRDTSKPRTELEALRHEVELLRFNLEVVLEKCRAQEAELRTLRASRDAAAAEARAATLLTRMAAAQVEVAEAARLKDFLKQQQLAVKQQKDAADAAVVSARSRLRLANVALDPTQEIEAALKAFREAPDNEAKRLAAEKLEGALKKLRQQLKPADSSKPQKQ